jgi:hypothetical protein
MLGWSRRVVMCGASVDDRGNTRCHAEGDQQQRDRPADPPPPTANDRLQHANRHTRPLLVHAGDGSTRRPLSHRLVR